MFTIVGYVDSENGCHIGLCCATEAEKDEDTGLYPLSLSEAYDYKYADYHHGSAESTKQPYCDRCLKPIQAEVE